MSCNTSGPQKGVETQLQPGEVRFDFKTYEKERFSLPGGRLIEVFVASTKDQQTQGLSGVKEGQLDSHQGMIFRYNSMSPRQFWMPNTFMDLDIYFLDGHYKVLKVDRRVPAHPGMAEPPLIARSSTVYAQHILELPSSSEYNQFIQQGTTLRAVK